jgi:hypothetical protein
MLLSWITVVSARGLRDGLMVTFQKEYSAYTAGWMETIARSESVEEFVRSTT